ncbi:MAG: NAD-dependent epimerase/dehydratase family protein [Polyangiales bacterium]
MPVTVVTGANGHLGVCLVKRLLELGRPVLALDREAGPWLREMGVEVRLGDIRDMDFLRASLGPGDVVFHLASLISMAGDRDEVMSSVNVGGAALVARAALERGVKRMVHFSSVYAFDVMAHGVPVTEATRLATDAGSTAAYSRSKALGQQAVLALVAEGLDAVVVNPCGVIGPYDFKVSLQGGVLRDVMKGRRWHAEGGCNWVDVRDVVEGALLAEAKGRTGECYILGHPNQTTHLELAQMARRVMGDSTAERALPMPVLRGLATTLAWVERVVGVPQVLTHEALDTLLANPRISSDKAIRELGFRARPLEETVRDTYAWYVETGQLPRRRGGSAPSRPRPMVEHEVTVEIAASPEEVYAFLSDVSQMRTWLARCVEVRRLSQGSPSLSAGDRLIYTYSERSRRATIEGTVEAAEPGRRLDFRFKDRAMFLRVGFELSPLSGATRVRHYVEVEPQIVLVELMRPFFQRGIAKDTAKDVARLKEVIEARP